LASTPGCEQEKIFENLAFGYWLLAFGQKNRQRTRRSMVLSQVATLCRFGLGLGLGLGGPWVTQAWPKGHPSATQGPPKGGFAKVLCLQHKLEKGRGGVVEDRGNRKGKTLPLINTDDTDLRWVGNTLVVKSHRGSHMAEPTYEEMKARLAELEKQVATKRTGAMEFRVSEKGGVSVYGLGRFPVTLYFEQWTRLLDQADNLRAFLEENKSKLKLKEPK
jgi:hypothetical protein